MMTCFQKFTSKTLVFIFCFASFSALGLRSGLAASKQPPSEKKADVFADNARSGITDSSRFDKSGEQSTDIEPASEKSKDSSVIVPDARSITVDRTPATHTHPDNFEN